MSPTQEHEHLLELVRNRPTLVPYLLGELGITVPSFDKAVLGNTDFANCVPTEFSADSVVTLTRRGKAVHAVVLEVQRKIDKKKKWSWPVYLSTLRSRQECPVMLLVFCQDAKTAQECAKAIDMGHPGWVLQPIVLGANDVPPISDVAQAISQPELMAFSTVAHGCSNSEAKAKVLRTFIDAIAQGPKNRPSYSELVLKLLPRSDAEKLYKELEMTVNVDDLMHLSFVREWVERGKVEGKVEGRAEGEAVAILRFLSKRGITVPHDAAERILACTDQQTLESWIDKAVTATSIDELFEA